MNDNHIGNIIKSSLKTMNEKLYIRYLRESVFYDWEKIVGKANAKKIKPLRIEYKKLYLYSKDSNWKATVFSYKSIFIKKINEYLGENLIEEIIFGNSYEKPKEDKNIVLNPKSKCDDSKELKNIKLTAKEIEEIEQSCACIEDEELRKTFLETSINRAKLEKYRLKKDWNECRNCGNLCPPDEEICNVCKRIEKDAFSATVVKILNNEPFLTYGGIKKEIEKNFPDMMSYCIPETIAGIKSTMIQNICSRLDKNDKNMVNFLVMLYKSVKREDMTPILVNNTLHELRNNIIKKERRIKFEG